MPIFDNTSDFKQNYRLLIGSIVPRPIAVVSTRNLDGSFNLAPFSFFTVASALPPIIAFCPMWRTSTNSKKDTVINIEREKEFVVSLCTEANCNLVNLASTELPYGEDEFTLTGLTPLPAKKVKAPLLKESPVKMECILRDILNYGDHPGAGRIITGEVVCFHVEDSAYEEGQVLVEKVKQVARGGGNDWFKTTDRFELERLTKAQIQKL